MSRIIDKYNFITQQDYEAVSGPDWPTYASFQQHQDVPNFVYDEIDRMLTPQQPFDHPSFCVLPFYGWEYPRNTACCFLPPTHDLEQIKNDMLNGLKPNSCYKCWNLEEAGHKSDRQLKNETIDFYFHKNIHDIFKDCQHGKNHVNHYKIDTSNTCNAMCITCGGDVSSSWNKLLKSNKQLSMKNWRISPNKIDLQIDYKTAKLINFRGGEPLLSKTNFHILEQLLLVGNTECFISFQTNGSITPTDDQEALLRNFKNLNFSFSIDGIGPVFEYLRYPLKWADIEKNINWCRQRNIMISINYTISNLNVFYHEQTTSWFKKNKIPYLYNLVYSPEWFAPSVLPLSVKSRINFDFVNSDKDNEWYAVFKEKISQQDTWKGISMHDYLPELAELLD
jgi:MoaA/NifB/PqqE/SkfB family radical SAM enzyme